MLTKAAPIVNMYSLTEYTDCAAEPELWHLNSATTTEYELRSPYGVHRGNRGWADPLDDSLGTVTR